MLGPLLHGSEQRDHRCGPAQRSVVLDDEYKLRARRVHGAPHAQREASVLDLFDQLCLFEGRCAGLARSTHALLVLLVPRRSIVRYLALLPPRLRSRVRNRANGEWACVLLEVTG